MMKACQLFSSHMREKEQQDYEAAFKKRQG